MISTRNPRVSQTTPKYSIHQPLLFQPAPLAGFFLLLPLPSLLSSPLLFLPISPLFLLLISFFFSPFIFLSYIPSSLPSSFFEEPVPYLVSTRRFRLGPPPPKSRISIISFGDNLTFGVLPQEWKKSSRSSLCRTHNRRVRCQELQVTCSPNVLVLIPSID